MTATMRLAGRATLEEMEEFAAFPKGTQRYIRRSLDIGLDHRNAASRWLETRPRFSPA